SIETSSSAKSGGSPRASGSRTPPSSMRWAIPPAIARRSLRAPATWCSSTKWIGRCGAPSRSAWPTGCTSSACPTSCGGPRGPASGWTVAVGLPSVAPLHRDRLLRARDAAGDDARAAAPETSAGIEPLCACYRTGEIAPRLRAAWERGERSVQRALVALGRALVRVNAEDETCWPGGPATLESLNTPEEWEAAERRLARGSAWIEET